MSFKKLIDESLKRYSALEINRKPKLVWKIDPVQEEFVSLEYAGGVLHVEANNERNLLFAFEQAMAALLSGHLGEFLGRVKPRFPLRPLWLGCEQSVRLSSSVSVGMPDEQSLEPFCQRLCRLGYNAVILGKRDETFHEKEGKIDLSTFQDYGIKVFVKPDVSCGSPLDSFAGLPENCALFWKSDLLHPDFQNHPGAFDLTLYDIVEKELKLVEGAAGKRELIFYIPTEDEASAKLQSLWLSDLIDNAGSRTTIAFSAVAGDPCGDHLPPHPFWEVLRVSPDCSATPLLPLINTGAVKQGECLWPSLPFDLLHQFLPRLERHPFAGFIGLAHHVPEGHGLLHLALWVAAQALWRGKSPSVSAETWSLANRPDWKFSAHAEDLDKVKGIVKRVGARRERLAREEREALLADLALLDYKFNNGSKKGENPGFADYYTYFAIDMRNLFPAKAIMKAGSLFGQKHKQEKLLS